MNGVAVDTARLPGSAGIIPMVVFAYRRPDLLKQVLDALQREGIPLLIVYCDGARGTEDADEVTEVRQMVRSIDWCRTVIHESHINRGLGASVKRGVTAVLADFDAAVFFEDDLVCVQGTYAYLCAALDAYRDDPQVMSVTAWTHPAILPKEQGAQPYFDGKAECWAWGTWARSWRGMEQPALDIMIACINKHINIQRYGTDMPKMASEAARRNLWAIGWWYHHLRHGGLCLRPPWSLVEHLGWDERSTTTSPAMQRWLNPPLQAAPPIPTMWPAPAEHPACAPLWRRAIDGNPVM